MGNDDRGRSGVLPAELTSFVGRRADLMRVGAALVESRLVSIVGFGGVGKTRVAVNVARKLRRQFRDGVWLVELSNLSDPALIPHEVLAALGVSDVSASGQSTVLRDYLSRRSLLLVLDGCERVTAGTAATVLSCLDSAPGLRVLVTSRERLRVFGERVVPLEPLPVPATTDAEIIDSLTWPSMTLFRDRAEAAVPGLDLGHGDDDAIARICQRLEGIPLAMELAANQLQIMSVRDLDERLSNRFELLNDAAFGLPDRHQTLRATLDWSYDLCSPAEQTLWARASVFAGSFTLALAESVCSGVDLPRHSVVGCVRGLVDKSVLVRAESDGEVRFRLPDTMSEYGLSVLRGRKEEVQARDRCARALVEVFEEANARWFGSDEGRWLSRLRGERTNLRAALDHSVGPQGQPEVAVRLASASWLYWVAGGHLSEGRLWLARALDQEPAPTAHKAHALWACAYLAALQGDHLKAEAFAFESSALAQRLQDPLAQAHATHVLGLGVVLMGDSGRGSMLLRSALLLYRDVPSADGLSALLHIHVGLNQLLLDDLTSAHDVFADCDDLCADRGDRWIRSYALAFKGLVHLFRGQGDRARHDIRDGLRLARSVEDTVSTALAFDLLGWVAASDEQPRHAAQLLGAAAKVWDDLGSPVFGAETLATHREGAHRRALDELGEVAFADAYDEGRSLGLLEATRRALGEPERSREEAQKHRPTVGANGRTELGPREWQVATLLRDGLSNKEIASTLVISRRTVETHVQNILQKLGFSSRTQVAMWASRQTDYLGTD